MNSFWWCSPKTMQSFGQEATHFRCTGLTKPVFLSLSLFLRPAPPAALPWNCLVIGILLAGCCCCGYRYHTVLEIHLSFFVWMIHLFICPHLHYKSFVVHSHILCIFFSPQLVKAEERPLESGSAWTFFLQLQFFLVILATCCSGCELCRSWCASTLFLPLSLPFSFPVHMSHLWTLSDVTSCSIFFFCWNRKLEGPQTLWWLYLHVFIPRWGAAEWRSFVMAALSVRGPRLYSAVDCQCTS